STSVNEATPPLSADTDTYDVVLTSEPTDTVTITISVFETPVQTTVSVTTLTFDNSNWDAAQTVTLTAVDDAVVEGAHSSLITHSAAST
ncbi:hypothetical protein, partial [Isoptericola croceus]|uniref:hypothetical protein n=1 Tax=Isoptericola croceus TaxID=3031406 RepID=UPI0023F9C2D0